MTNKEANRAAKHYALFHGAKLVRRVPVDINGVRHYRIELEWKFGGEPISKEFQVDEQTLNQYL